MYRKKRRNNFFMAVKDFYAVQCVQCQHEMIFLVFNGDSSDYQCEKCKKYFGVNDFESLVRHEESFGANNIWVKWEMNKIGIMSVMALPDNFSK